MKMTSHAVTLFFVQTLLFFTSSLSFSLKNCTIESAVKVVSVLCQSGELQEVPTDIPLNTNALDVSFNNISQIKVTDFKHFTQLVTLGVTHNQLYHIEDYAFGDLKELKFLRLSHNKLTNLTDNMFVGLSKLIGLDLRRNRISKISPKAFQPLLCLVRVILNENHIDNTTDMTPLFTLPNIEQIYLFYNDLTSFDSDKLRLNTSNVKSLDLAYNRLDKFSLKQDIFPYLRSIDLTTKSFEWDVTNNTFLRNVTKLSLRRIDLITFIALLNSTVNLEDLSLTAMAQISLKSLVQVACSKVSIKRINLKLNILGTIDDQMFHGCSHVTELDLSSSFTKLSDQSLKSMKELQVLDLSHNTLQKVPLAIRGQFNLEKLFLDYNYISEINCLDFANLTKLTVLGLRRNNIVTLDECVFQNLYSLNTLDIGQNSVRSFNEAFRVNMPKLEILLFTNNVDRFLLQQGEFRNLSSLRVLNLKSAKYFYSHDGAFEGLSRLQRLICSTSLMTKEIFEGLHSLRYLELHLGSFLLYKTPQNTSSDPPFSGLPNLITLFLYADTKFSPDVSPNLFSGLKSLDYLKTDNFFRMSIHPDTFKYTPQLTSLDITNSDLSFLSPEVFNPITKLQQIDLSHNKFSTLDFLANLRTLQVIKVCDNQLSVINDTIFQTLPSLTYLDISQNTLLCDCLNAGFQQWAQTNNQTQVVNGYQYKCVSPVTQKEEIFLNFDTRSCWIDVGLICFTSSTSVILLFLFVCFVFHFLRFHLVYAYYLFLAHRYDKRKKRGDGNLYDAFISFNVHDEDWVYKEMLPALEGEQGWRLCLHHRDFEPGKPIVENITDAIYGSRKTICVISRHYLQSEWCSREIQMASVRLFDEKKDVLVLVFLEDIPTWQLSPYYQMRRVVKKRTYLSWPQAARHKGVFWQKLHQALNADNNPNDDRHLIIEPEEDH